MALAGNGRWCWLDPKLGAMHAVAEAARKVACTGATPVAATNCLNFGNPEKPEIMAQLSAAIDGIAEACTALDVPITGGNVSLYNETKGEGIYPTPVVGVVGLLYDVTKAVPSGFQNVGDAILVLYAPDKTPRTREQRHTRFLRLLGATEFSRVCLNGFWGEVIDLDMTGDPRLLNATDDARLNRLLGDLATSSLIHSANDVGSGGLAVCLARCAMTNGIGADVDHIAPSVEGGMIVPNKEDALSLFTEGGAAVVLTCAWEKREENSALAQTRSLYAMCVGKTVSSQLVVRAGSEPFIDLSIADLRAAFSGTLESQLAAEVVTG
jgi:phosphoribosylformylglycinamidine synthase